MILLDPVTLPAPLNVNVLLPATNSMLLAEICILPAEICILPAGPMILPTTLKLLATVNPRFSVMTLLAKL